MEHSAICSTLIKLPFVIKIFVLSIFETPFYIRQVLLYSNALAGVCVWGGGGGGGGGDVAQLVTHQINILTFMDCKT